MTIWQNRKFHRCLLRKPYSRATHETQLSASVLTFRIPVMCRAYALLCRMLSCEIPAKTSSVFNSFSFHTHTLSLSITQPLQSNPTINTRHKRLNKITIKFDTELKLTKHIVVNHNFTISAFSYFVTKPLKQTLDLNVSLGTMEKLTHT